MIIHDISLEISQNLPVWPDDPGVILECTQTIEDGSVINVSRIEMGVHTGTHIDAPFHFLGEGAPTIEKLSLEKLVGPAYLIEVPNEVDILSKQVLHDASIPDNVIRLLIKTRNSQLWVRTEPEFKQDFVAVSADGAQYLVDRGIQVVGVDYLSVAPFNNVVPTHQILLKSSVIIIEGLKLSGVKGGSYSLYCLPLNIVGADGAPARVILTEP